MAAMEVKKVYCRRKREKSQQIDHIPKCFQLPRTPSASKPRTDFSLPICSSKDIELEPLSSKEIQSSVIVGSSDTSNDKIRDIDDPSSTRSTEPESRRQETPTNCMELTVVKSFGEKAQMQPCSNRNDEGRDDNATVLEFTPNRSQLTENSEVCATPGSVVWAKTGQCWWPAEILGEKSSKSGSRVERHLLVQYFGKNGSAWVDPATDLSPFEECFKERSCNRAKEFQNALKQALHYKEHPRSCKESSGSPDGRDRSSHQLPAGTMTSTEPKTGSRKDPSWKYGVEIEVPGGKAGKKVTIVKGGVKRMKEHLACTHKDVVPCPNVPLEVKDEINQYLKNFQNAKFAYQRNFDEMIASETYFVDDRGDSGILSEGMNSCRSGSDRGIRGPMDRFLEKKGDDTNAKEMATSANEHRSEVCSDIGRFFIENGIPFSCARSPSYFKMLHSVGNYGQGLQSADDA
ncbi:hypothetical protein OSB04_009956 [Centaurea solstitialis]|uniref:PWWP domain-containing protein n=1 Tax=Centaurea solstitialis TaxID=347529 RepID=A0AA38TPP8_9ASTR|nr:hypothetical protein OSB04_009956 [Centaurea solstitialis]